MNQKSIDWITISIAVLLYLFGVLTLFSVDYALGQKQLFWGVLGVVIILIGIIITHNTSNFFENYAPIIYIFCILLLIGLFPFGKEINGAKAWYSFGGKFSLQPAEFAKIATGLMIARVLSENEVLGRQTSTSFLKSIMFLLIPILLILLQPDLGSIIVFSAFVIALTKEGLGNWIVLIPILLIFIFTLSILWDPVLIVIGFAFLLLFTSIIYLIFSPNVNLIKNINNILTSIFLSLSVVFQIILFIELYQTPIINFDEFFNYQFSILASGVGSIISLILSLILYQHKVKQKKIYGYTMENDYNNGLIIKLSSIILGVFILLSIFSFYSKKIFEVLPKHHKERVMVLFEGEEKYRKTSGYNLLQSKIAIGTGKLTGKGWNKGPITDGKHVPEQPTDYIFTAIGEEWGFLGSMVVIILYSSLICRIFYMAENQKSVFNRYFGNSIGCIFLIHFSLNIGMVTGLFPTVGIPLPFFSYGGSSLWAFCMMLFIFLKNNFEENESLL